MQKNTFDFRQIRDLQKTGYRTQKTAYDRTWLSTDPVYFAENRGEKRAATYEMLAQRRKGAETRRSGQEGTAPRTLCDFVPLW